MPHASPLTGWTVGVSWGAEGFCRRSSGSTSGVATADDLSPSVVSRLRPLGRPPLEGEEAPLATTASTSLEATSSSWSITAGGSGVKMAATVSFLANSLADAAAPLAAGAFLTGDLGLAASLDDVEAAGIRFLVRSVGLGPDVSPARVGAGLEAPFVLDCVVVDAAVFDVAPGLAAPGLAAPGLVEAVVAEVVAALEDAVVLEEPAALLEESGTRGLAAAVEPPAGLAGDEAGLGEAVRAAATLLAAAVGFEAAPPGPAVLVTPGAALDEAVAEAVVVREVSGFLVPDTSGLEAAAVLEAAGAAVFGTAGFEAAGLAAEGAGLVDDGAGLVGAEAAFVTAGLGAGLEAVVAPVNGFLAAEGPVAGRLAAADPGLDPATEEVAEDPGPRLEAAADAAEGTLAAAGLAVAGLAPAAVAGLEAAGLVEVVLDAAAGAEERGFLVGPAAPGLAEAALASFLTTLGAAAPGLDEARGFLAPPAAAPGPAFLTAPGAALAFSAAAGFLAASSLTGSVTVFTGSGLVVDSSAGGTGVLGTTLMSGAVSDTWASTFKGVEVSIGGGTSSTLASSTAATVASGTTSGLTGSATTGSWTSGSTGASSMAAGGSGEGTVTAVTVVSGEAALTAGSGEAGFPSSATTGVGGSSETGSLVASKTFSSSTSPMGLFSGVGSVTVNKTGSSETTDVVSPSLGGVKRAAAGVSGSGVLAFSAAASASSLSSNGDETLSASSAGSTFSTSVSVSLIMPDGTGLLLGADSSRGSTVAGTGDGDLATSSTGACASSESPMTSDSTTVLTESLTDPVSSSATFSGSSSWWWTPLG